MAVRPDDRFPLLCVSVKAAPADHEVPPPVELVRGKTMARSAAAILTAWPQATQSWCLALLAGFVAATALLVLLTGFMLGSFSSRSSFLVNQCDRSELTGVLHLEPLNDLPYHENATYFVGVSGEWGDLDGAARAIKAYLASTTAPVYYIHVGPRKDLLKLAAGDVRALARLQNTHPHFHLVFVNTEKFLLGTRFQHLGELEPSFLKLLAKILVAWTYGGVVIDAEWEPQGAWDRERLAGPHDAVLWLGGGDIAALDVRHYCHAFLHEMLSVLARGEATTPYTVVCEATKRFCGSQRHRGVVLLSTPYTCTPDSSTPDCSFFLPTPQSSPFSSDTFPTPSLP